jgi:hypothetical protein
VTFAIILTCPWVGGPQPISILQAAYTAKDAAIAENDLIKIERCKNVIDHLEDQGAVLAPTNTQERQRRSKSLMRLPTWREMAVVYALQNMAANCEAMPVPFP